MPDRHECELVATDSDSIFPTPQPGSSLPVAWLRSFRMWCTISRTNPRSRYHITSLARFAGEQRRQTKQLKWWIIHPFSNARFTWEMVMLTIYAISFLTIPFMVCFHVLDFSGIHMDNVNLYIYAFCWLDIIMNCISGTYDKINMEVILEQRQILKDYAKTFLFWDVLTSLPYDRLTKPWRRTRNENPSGYILILNLIPILKLSRCWTVVTYIRRLFRVLKLEELSHQMFNTGVLSLYFIHWLTCLCITLPVFMMTVMKEEVCQDCWMDMLNMDIGAKYRHALFMAVNNLSSSSYGVYEPRLEGHAVACILLTIIGRLFESFLIVMILEIKSGLQSSQTKYLEIMNQLKAYMRHKQLPSYMRRRLLAYYHYRFMNSYFREKAILSSLSEHLYNEIVLHSCRRLVENVAIFRTLPKSVLEKIVANLKLELFLPNDVIVKAGTQGDCMFFLASGTVAVLTTSGKEICHLEDGAHFGEVALLVQDQRRVATVMAIEVCEVYRLDRKDFRRCIAVQSDLFARIEHIATDRMEKTVLIEEQHKRFLLQRTSRGSTYGRHGTKQTKKPTV